MNPDALPAVAILATAFLIGGRSTRRVYKRYRAIAGFLTPGRRLLGQAFVVICVVVMLAVGWYGFVSVRSMLGFDRLEWAALVSFAVAIPVLFLPVYIEWVWNTVARRGDVVIEVGDEEEVIP